MFPVFQKVEPVVEKGDRSQDMAALGVILLELLVVCWCRSSGSDSTSCTAVVVIVSTCIGRLLGEMCSSSFS